MAHEVKKLFQNHNLNIPGIISMAGHEEGIITFGNTADETGYLMLEYLERSKN